MVETRLASPPGKGAFSLVEVSLALGILALALVTLIGLLVPAMNQAREVRLTHATNEMIANLSERLMHLDLDTDPTTSPFDELFSRVAGSPEVFYLFNQLEGGVVFTAEPQEVESVDRYLFAARLQPSGVNPSALLAEAEDGYTLTVSDPDAYPEAYLALQVDLYSLPFPPPGSAFTEVDLTEDNFLVRYQTAILR